MQVTYRAIRWRNLLATGNAWISIPLDKYNSTLMFGKNGHGKAQPLTSKVLTPTGWKLMGELSIGDLVVNPTTGSPAKINAIYPQGSKQVFLVKFSDGRIVECCSEHLWKVWGTFGGQKRDQYWNYQVKSVTELIEHKANRKRLAGRIYVPLVKQIDLPEQHLVIDPYLLGVLIGDGNFTDKGFSITSSDQFIVDQVRQLVFPQVLTQTGKYGYNIGSDIYRSHSNPLREEMKAIGLWNHTCESKFIPDQYMCGSYQQRLSLLQGLMDTDGTVGRFKNCSFTSAYETLAKQVQRLVWSLGGIAKIRQYGLKRFDVGIRIPNPENLFRLPRKRNRAQGYQYSETLRVEIVDIVATDQFVPMQCISLDSDNQLYCTDDYIVTHNSQLLDAICFVLFNKPFRKISKAQLVNTINNKNTVVELVLTKGSDTYRIVRGIKPNVFEIHCNGKLVEQRADSKEYQSLLEENIICTNYKTFCQVNILGKATYVPFMELPAQHRREVVEELLDSQIYSAMAVLAKTEVKLLKEQLSDLRTQIEKADLAVEAQQALIARQSENDQKTLDGINSQIAAHQNEWDTYKASYAEITERLATADQQRKDVLPDPDKAQEIRRQLSGELSKLEMKIAEYDSEIRMVDIEICPRCQQKVDENHRHSIVDNLKTKSVEDGDKLSVLKRRDQRVKDMMLAYGQLNQAYNNVANELSRCEQQLNAHKNQITRLKQQLAAAEQVVTTEDDKAKLVQLMDKHDELTNEYNRLSESYSISVKALEYLGDDGIKAKLVSKYVPVINSTLNNYLDRMDLFALFELDEQFNETIKSRHRDTFTYNSFSEGEKLRINIAILFTWRQIAKLRNSVSSNLLIMDEILDSSLDDDGVKDFMNILRNMSDAQNTIIISHRQTAVDGFDNSILVKKNGNFSEYTSSQ